MGSRFQPGTGRSASLTLTNAAIIFSLALFVRLVAQHFIHWPVVTDLLWNDQVALNILGGHGVSASVTAPYLPAVFRTPGYPGFLAMVYAVFGHSYKAALLAQAALDSLTAVVMAATAARLAGRALGVVTGLLYAVYVYSAALSTILHQDMLLTFLLCIAVYWTVKAQSAPEKLTHWALIGAVTAAAVLVKPIIAAWIVVPIVVAFVTDMPRRRKATTLIVLLATLSAGLAPWLVRNYVEYHEFPLLATGTPADAGFGTLVDEMKSPTGLAGYEVPSGDLSRTRGQYLSQFPEGRALIDSTRQARQQNLRWLKQHWARWVATTAMNVPRLWISMQSRFQLGWRSYLLIAFSSLVFLVGAVGMMVAWPFRRKLLPLYLTLAMVTVVYAPLHVEARYTLPARPVMMYFCAVFLLYAFERLGRHEVLSTNATPMAAKAEVGR